MKQGNKIKATTIIC